RGPRNVRTPDRADGARQLTVVPPLPIAERGSGGEDVARAVVPSLPLRDHRAVGSDTAAVLPFQSPGVRDRLPGGQIHRRRGGTLPAALCPARMARCRRASPGVDHGRPVRAPDDPLAPDGLVAARRELTFLLA